MSENKGDFLIGLLVGGAIGAAVALLYAPQSGEATRDELKKRSDEIKDKAVETYDLVKDQTTTLAAQVKDSSTSLAAQVKDSAGQVASRVGETVEKVKADVADGVASVKGATTAEADKLTQKAQTETARLKQAVAPTEDSAPAATI